MNVFDYLNQAAGKSAQKQQEVTALASDKKSAISGKPDMYKVQAAIANPELMEGLSEQERDLATLNSAQLFDKYGFERPGSTEGFLDANRQYNTDVSSERTTPQVIGDTAIGVGQGVGHRDIAHTSAAL